MTNTGKAIPTKYLTITIPEKCKNVILLTDKEQLVLFPPVVSKEKYYELTEEFNEATKAIRDHLKNTYFLSEHQEVKFSLTTVGVVISHYSWSRLVWESLITISDFAKDKNLQVFVVG